MSSPLGLKHRTTYFGVLLNLVWNIIHILLHNLHRIEVNSKAICYENISIKKEKKRTEKEK